MAFRFLHLADLHLDSSYGGSPTTVERLRLGTLQALERATQLAIEAGLDAVLIAGDAFDDDRLGYESRAVFRREVARLAEAGVSVVYTTGNHDPGTVTGRAANLKLSPLGSRGGSVHVVLDGEAQTLPLRDRSGQEAAVVVAAGHSSSRVTDNLVAPMRTAMERARSRGLPVIGLTHTQVGSARGADGHQPYAPCSVADLMACDADYWALGHVHVRGRIDPAVPAYYSGNLQGRHAKETGAKGGLLVELDADGLDGEPEFVALAPVEFFSCAVELPSSAEPEEVAERVAAALDAAAADGRGPTARELVLRVSHGVGYRFDGDFEAAVREEVQRKSGPVFGDILEVELRPAAASAAPAAREASVQDMLRAIEQTPSALREALIVCAERDAANGTRLADALIDRLRLGSEGARHA